MAARTPAKKSTASRSAAARTPRTKTLAETTAETKHTRTRRALETTHSTRMTTVNGALTAAASLMTATPTKGSGTGATSPTRTWQHAGSGYVKTVPELGAAKLFVGNCHARVRLKVGKRNPDGTVDPLPDGWDEIDPDTGLPKAALPEGVDPRIAELAAAAIASLRMEIGGPGELLRSYGEKVFVTGEMYLVPATGVSGLTFEVLSTLELSKDGSRWVRIVGPNGETEMLPEGTEPLRIWRPDDQYGRLATSSVRACLEVLEELVILTRLVRSAAIARMALAGILVLADEMDEPLEEAGEDGQTSEQTNPLAVDIIMSGAKAIDDPASAAAWMPYILQVPKDLVKDGINLVEFKGDDAINITKRSEAIQRLAQGLDLPVEVVTGHQQTTFANAGQVSEDTFKLHIEPSVSLFADAATVGVLWPALAASLGVQPETVAASGYPPEVLSVAVAYDASGLISRPDKAKDIVSVFNGDHTQMAVRIAEVRGALGLTPEDAPDDAEVAARLLAYQQSNVKEVATVIPNVEAEPVLPTDAAIGVTASLAVAASLAHRIAGAAELTMERTAERIGARLRPKLKGTQATTMAQVPNSELTRALGPAVVKRLLGDDDGIDVEMAAFARSVARWAGDASLRHPGQLAEAVASILATTTIDRLYSAAPPTFDVETFVALAAAGAPAPSEP